MHSSTTTGQLVLDPFMIHELIPALTESAFGNHPLRVVSVTYRILWPFHGDVLQGRESTNLGHRSPRPSRHGLDLIRCTRFCARCPHRERLLVVLGVSVRWRQMVSNEPGRLKLKGLTIEVQKLCLLMVCLPGPSDGPNQSESTRPGIKASRSNPA
jgi:hypothetical protein